MANLRSVETSMRIYRGIAVSSSTISQLESQADMILHSLGIHDFTSPRISGASLLRRSVMTKTRKSSAELRFHPMQRIAETINDYMPPTSYDPLPVRLSEAYVVHTTEQPWRYDIAVGFANKTFDEERNAVYEQLGQLAFQDVLIEGYPEIRLGCTRKEIPYEAVELLQQDLPRAIELEPVEFVILSEN